MTDLVTGRDRPRNYFGFNWKSSSATGSDSYTELLDGLILLYHVGVHKHYVKVKYLERISSIGICLIQVAEVMDSLREYTESLTDINDKLSNCHENSSEIRDELLRSKKIFEQQAEDLTRKIAWVTIHVFSHVSSVNHDLKTINKIVLQGQTSRYHCSSPLCCSYITLRFRRGKFIYFRTRNLSE